MNVDFANEFAMKLFGKLEDKDIKIVRDNLVVFLSDYEVNKKCTDVIEYGYYVPQEVCKYIAIRSIEGIAVSSLENYKDELYRFFNFCKKQVKEVNTDDVLIYLAKCKEQGVSNHTLDTRRTYIQTFFVWCVNRDIISKNPCVSILPIKYRVNKEPALNGEQEEKIRDYFSNNKRNLAMFDFFISTGCRVSELCNIKMSDVDFVKKEVVVIGKGNKKRTVYISDKAMYTLRNYLENRGYENQYLFCKERKPHTKLTKEAIESLYRDASKNIDVGRLHPHRLRRTFATNAYRKGAPIEIVQKWLGHENTNTTEIYLDVYNDDLRNAHRKYVS